MLRILCLLLLLPANRVPLPQPSLTFDLKPYGFATGPAGDLTVVGFASEDEITVYLHQRPAIYLHQRSADESWSGKMIRFSISQQKPVSVLDHLSCEVRFLPGGSWLCFHSDQVDLYGSDLKIRKTYTAPAGAHLDFAATSNQVKLSPDRLRVSFPVDHGSEILATDDLTLLQTTTRRIVALGQDRWFVDTWPSLISIEQMSLHNVVTDIGQAGRSQCLVWPNYLSANFVLVENCNGKNVVLDHDGVARYRLGKTIGNLEVVPDISGNRFALELYVAKEFDWSGAAQYKKIVLNAFDTSSGNEIFHLEEVPSESEHTFNHYFALSPSGKRLASIRAGILRIYDLAP